MSDHDPLCPWPDPTSPGDECPYCELIVAARRDERERVAEKGAALMGMNEHLIRADERERIAQELAARELTARALAGQYFEGARDAFDEAEQIARADRR